MNLSQFLKMPSVTALNSAWEMIIKTLWSIYNLLNESFHNHL